MACGRGALVVLMLVAGCSNDRQPQASPKASQSEPEHAWFTERAGASGLDFVHFNGMSGEFYYPEIMAPGVALIDYDNDGDLDVYVTQGQMLGASKTIADALFPPKGPLKDRLFRNDLVVHEDGTRTLHLTDVTDASGIELRTYGMGAAVGDFDNDAFPDIYRTGLSGGVMLRNNGDGTFTDVTRQTGTENRGGWGVSAAFVDYDRDGWLDLFVGNYLNYSTAADVHCLSVTGRRDRRLQPRPLDRHLRRQRRPAEPALDQPAQRHVQRDRISFGLGRRRDGSGGSQHGRRRGRLRQRRRRGSVRDELARPDERALRERRRRQLRGSAGCVRIGIAESGQDR